MGCPKNVSPEVAMVTGESADLNLGYFLVVALLFPVVLVISILASASILLLREKW